MERQGIRAIAEVRYQVFVSSTYADLKDERQAVIQSLLELDCIPSGMELFPAANEEQFEYIKRIIDVSDYYVLIIGGRYGSMTEAGISYTEMEYDYAMEQGKPVCSFVHADPGAIASAKTERSSEIAQKLDAFRAKVMKGRLVKTWRNRDDLLAAVLVSISHAIKRYPSAGWIRGDHAVSVSTYEELEALRKENASLKQKATAEQINQKKPIKLRFRNTFGSEPSGTETEREITLGRIVSIVPVGYLDNRIAPMTLANLVTEEVFGFQEAIEHEIKPDSLEELVFVLDQAGYANSHAGLISFTTKFRRAKLKIDYGLEPG